MDLDKFMREIKPRQNPYRVTGFSFGSRMEETYSNTGQLLGPGAYTISSPTSNVGGRFGNSERFDKSPQHKADVPGPGSYTSEELSPNLIKSKKRLTHSPNGKMTKSMGTFSKSERMGLFGKSDVSIGPGQYAIKREFENLSSVGKSQEFKITKDNSIASKTLRAFNIKDTDSPGPGQYDVTGSMNFGHKELPGFSVGNASRDFLGLNQTAKQGLSGDIFRYNVVEPFGRGSPKIGFGKGPRSELSPLKEGPSPTAYFTETTSSKVKGGVFPVANRKVNGKDHELGPGPGEYDVNVTGFTKGYKISEPLGISKKMSETSPGPGHYDVLTEFDDKRREIEKKLGIKSPKNSSTGVETSNLGQGDPQSTFYSSSIDKERSPRKLNSIKTMWVDQVIKQSMSPGPVYMVKTDHIEAQANSAGVRFSTVMRPDFVATEVRKNVPGPGAYEEIPEEQKDKHISFAVSKRKENPVLPEYTLAIPGPGRYENIKLAEPSGGSFGKATKKLDIDDDNSNASPNKRGKKGNRANKSRSPDRNS